MALDNQEKNIDKNLGSGIIIGRVKEIVLGPYKSGDPTIEDPNFNSYEDIGKIQFEFLYSPNSISLGAISKPAYPIFSAIKQFPVLGEIVFITRGPSPDLNDNFNNQRLYYFPPYALWNSVNHNTFPNMEEYSEFVKQYKTKPQYQGQSQTQNAEMPKGYSFSEKDIKSLAPFEGDTIIESRFGQSIRFGSTTTSMKKFNHWSDAGTNGAPITIIRNGQGQPSFPLDKFANTVEDINSDATSIYLTAGQKIIINQLSKFPLESFGTSIDPISQTIIESFQPTVSNYLNSAASQDSATQEKSNKKPN